MIRKSAVVLTVAAAMLLSMFNFGFGTTEAEAVTGRPTCPYYWVVSSANGNYIPLNSRPLPNVIDVAADGTKINRCNAQLAYPGPFTNMPDPVQGPYGWGSLNITAAAPATPAGGGTGGGYGGLAHTGSESTVIAYVGTGLIAFGAVALGSRRKFFQGALD